MPRAVFIDCAAIGHEPTPDALTPHSIRDQHTPDTSYLDLAVADTYPPS
ncbi:hypothetical protein IOD13_04670 [Brevibacterium casei]|nr:hypothetical protein [Brevibacterium casei]